MKLILSRKGFDSAAGKVPSPIFPDGRMVSLPIPDRLSIVEYKDIGWQDGLSLGDLVEALTAGRIPRHYRAHLDPDLRAESISRQAGWTAMLGQTGAAQGHLRNQGVGPGDLFLFFGLFRHVERTDGRWTYRRDCPPQHVLFGWLQVGQVWPVDVQTRTDLPWALYHPHFQRSPDPANTIYVAADRLALPSQDRIACPGAGVFNAYRPDLRLTAENVDRKRVWQLPGWFDPTGRRSALSFHGDASAWHREGDTVLLDSASRGQEFVLDCQDYPEAITWVLSLLGLD